MQQGGSDRFEEFVPVERGDGDVRGDVDASSGKAPHPVECILRITMAGMTPVGFQAGKADAHVGHVFCEEPFPIAVKETAVGDDVQLWGPSLGPGPALRIVGDKCGGFSPGVPDDLPEALFESGFAAGKGDPGNLVLIDEEVDQTAPLFGGHFPSGRVTSPGGFPRA